MRKLTKWAFTHIIQLVVLVLLANIILVAAGSITFAEERNPADVTIELEEGRLRLNGREIVMPSSIEPWVEALGPYSRGGEHRGWDHYIWDKIGISLLANSEGEIDDLVIEFRKLKMDWEEKQKPDPRLRETEYCFSGSFILNGVNLDATMPLWEYNHKVKKNKFSEDYIPIVYRIPGGKIPGTNYSFGVSARVGSDLRVYRVEVEYVSKDFYAPSLKEEETQPSHVEILKSELKNAVDSVKRCLGSAPETDAPKTGEGSK